MAYEQDDAIVLQRIDYSETSQILVMFTRQHGKVRLIAKGIKRSTKVRFATPAELLDHGRVVFSARAGSSAALGILTEWKPGAPLGGLRDSLERLYLALYLVELMAALTEEGDPDSELFAALLSTLRAAAKGDEIAALLFDFQCRLLDRIGSAPQWELCVGCRRRIAGSSNLWFSSSEGGALCQDCEAAYVEKRAVPMEAYGALTGRNRRPASMLTAARLLDYHVSHLIGKPTRTGSLLFDRVSQAIGRSPVPKGSPVADG